MAKVRINAKDVLREISSAVTDYARQEISVASRAESLAANKKLLKTFLSNEITKEINEGPDSRGGVLDEGNLFSFLGFEKGADPIEDLAKFLSNSIKIENISSDRKTMTVRVRISFPTLEDIDYFTELPWITKSWVRAIEDGISGLGAYLYSEDGFDTSRSDAGIQVEKAFSAQTFGSHEYLSEMLESISKKLVKSIRAKCV